MKNQTTTGALNLFNQNIAEVIVSYSHTVKFSDMPKLSSSQDAYDLLARIWPSDVDYIESFLVLLLNRANKVLGYKIVSKGGMAGTVADPKIIFATALKTASCSLILAHNHPSGNKRPSDADIELTKKLKQAGLVLELPILDHLIFTTDEGYFSFADEGLM
ncbi:MAG: JAB domain-containing protein [Bacteroidota bacterium]